jgi:hypothetical protein
MAEHPPSYPSSPGNFTTIIQMAHLVKGNAALCNIDRILPLTNDMGSDSYCFVNYVECLIKVYSLWNSLFNNICAQIFMEMSVVVAAALQSYQLEGLTVKHTDDNFILLVFYYATSAVYWSIRMYTQNTRKHIMFHSTYPGVSGSFCFNR